MRYGSVCSGIEAATCAWDGLGWIPQWFSEIEPFPSAVLTHHYPHVPNLGDMTKYKEWNCGAIDLLVGGTPCQSFSVAGLRKGLEDPRGNLMLTYVGLLDRFKPKWCVWENVPGVLSSNQGRDFGAFLGALAQFGYGFAYSVLDAQYFGVAQRRRRVFVVGCLAGWESAATVLFEPESLSGHPAPSRKKRQEVAATITARFGVSRNNHEECVVANRMVAFGEYTDDGTASAIKARDYKDAIDLIAYNISFCDVNGTRKDRPNGGLYVSETDITKTLNQSGVETYACAEVAPTIGSSGPPYSRTGNERVEADALAISSLAVRRLTPVECERLQGFPDEYTNIPWHKLQESPDGLRYKALGNSMAVPVMKWIGQRITQVENNVL
jgi:DNA (cytosine-5)-methyltransferase 1